MTAAVRDEIDELVDWQLEKRIGVCTSPMIDLAGIGWITGHEEYLLSAARWDPNRG